MTIRHILTIAATTSIAACALTSCDWIKDDLSDCPECQGTLSVKIEHRYNMLHADDMVFRAIEIQTDGTTILIAFHVSGFFDNVSEQQFCGNFRNGRGCEFDGFGDLRT